MLDARSDRQIAESGDAESGGTACGRGKLRQNSSVPKELRDISDIELQEMRLPGTIGRGQIRIAGAKL